MRRSTFRRTITAPAPEESAAIRTTSMDDINGATDRDQLRRFSRIPNERMYDGLWGASHAFVGAARVMAGLKINEIADQKIREKWLKSQQDEGQPTEDDIVREHFGPRGEKKDDPNKLPLEANTRRDWLIGW